MDIIKAVLLCFAPITALTFVIAYYSYKGGLISIRADKKDGWDITGSASQSGSEEESAEPSTTGNNLLHKKWVSFGGGFYGLMALLTFFVIEARQVMGFISGFEGWHTLTDLLSLGALIDLLVDSIMNFVEAMIWFTYWPDVIDMDNGWVWLGMAYAGYHLGRWLAELRLET